MSLYHSPSSLFTEVAKWILKFNGKCKGLRRGQTFLKKKDKVGGLLPAKFKPIRELQKPGSYGIVIKTNMEDSRLELTVQIQVNPF